MIRPRLEPENTRRMNAAPQPASLRPGQPDDEPPPYRGPDQIGLRRRHSAVVWAKRLLPAGALILLGAIALWPELDRATDQERVTLKHLTATTAGGARMLAPRYRSVDQRGRPFTITADRGMQTGANRITMVNPQADVGMSDGLWVMTDADHGTYMQHTGILDLTGDTTLYRSDGTTLITDSATIDTRDGAASSHDRTHAEGPFGTLDAQGFSLLDKGDVIQFSGPVRLLLDGHVAHAPAVPGEPR